MLPIRLMCLSLWICHFIGHFLLLLFLEVQYFCDVTLFLTVILKLTFKLMQLFLHLLNNTIKYISILKSDPSYWIVEMHNYYHWPRYWQLYKDSSVMLLTIAYYIPNLHLTLKRCIITTTCHIPEWHIK